MNTRSRFRGWLWAAAVTALIAAGLITAYSSRSQAPPAEGAGSFPPIPRVEAEGELGRLAAQPNEILDGGLEAFEARLEALRGDPVVVNQWASWCLPCRFEFPLLKNMAVEYADEVAFIGVDSRDDRDAAETFLRSEPTPYPHYSDPDAEIARSFGGGRAWPTTAFYNAQGDLTWTHQGVYPDEQALEDDIRTYALER